MISLPIPSYFMSSAVPQDTAQSAESWPSEDHTNKGKGRDCKAHTENQDLGKNLKTPDPFSSYPPINDDAEESRQVEEASLVSGQLAAF